MGGIITIYYLVLGPLLLFVRYRVPCRCANDAGAQSASAFLSTASVGVWRSVSKDLSKFILYTTTTFEWSESSFVMLFLIKQSFWQLLPEETGTHYLFVLYIGVWPVIFKSDYLWDYFEFWLDIFIYIEHF